MKITGVAKVFSITLLIGALTIASVLQTDRKVSRREILSIFTKALIQIERNYVEEKDPVKVIESGIRGMTESLDPFSDLLTPEESEEWKVRTEGKFGGLGIQIGIRNGWLTIIAPIEGTPAYRVGLRPGDQIIKIEGESTRGIKLQDAVKVLRGEPGTQVTITIKRPGVDDPIDFTITRDIIEIKTVPYFTKLNSGIGYVRLTQFSSQAYTEVKYAIDSLIKLGCDKFILDLRSNPGGLLQQAISISNLFLPEGSVVVFTRGRAWNTDTVFMAKRKPEIDPNIPLVVLVDAGSASASEIVAGALQDWDRAVIIGDTTFGKGSVQRIFPLGKGYQLKLTVARYYTPSGRSIHKEHIPPEEKISEKSLNNDDTLVVLEKVHPKYHTKRLKREIYGNGGIVPDIVLESKKPHRLVMKAFSKSAFFDFAVEYYQTHADIKGIADIVIDDETMKSFKDLMKSKGVSFDEGEFQEALDDLKNFLTQEIAEKYFGIKGRYMAALMNDPVLGKAIEILRLANNADDIFVMLERTESE